jgi:hypothetical protein
MTGKEHKAAGAVRPVIEQIFPHKVGAAVVQRVLAGRQPDKTMPGHVTEGHVVIPHTLAGVADTIRDRYPVIDAGKINITQTTDKRVVGSPYKPFVKANNRNVLNDNITTIQIAGAMLPMERPVVSSVGFPSASKIGSPLLSAVYSRA